MLIFFENLNKARSIYNKEQLLIKRCGSFGYDVSHKCNFKCPAGIYKVVIASDMNVYPCIYMVKPEYKIGKYIDGEVLNDSTLYFLNKNILKYRKESEKIWLLIRRLISGQIHMEQ